MKRLIFFVDPISRLGIRKYSWFVPLLTMILLSVFSEVFALWIMNNPDSVGMYAIFLFVAFIIYFAFRDGIKGGVIATFVTTSYYGYIIYSRTQTYEELIVSIQATIMLTLVYLALALLIGWLKQKIDSLIVREADERRRLQAIVQQLPVGVVITDGDGNIIQENKQIDLILGQSAKKNLTIDKEMTSKGSQKNSKTSQAQWPLIQTLTTRKSIIGKEFEITRDNGKKVFVQISSSLIENKEGKPIAVALIVNDVTQQKEMEERKDDFVNMASHELKSPITSLKLYIELLSRHLKSKKDRKGSKTVSSIMSQTERLQELVSDLLDVSRLQTGKLSFKKEIFRIDQLVQETIKTLHDSTNNHKVVVSKSPPINVLADKFRIYQVITNLVTNAIKYSPAGTAINVTVKRSNGKVVVSVKDRGIGIEKEQQKKIFDRLYQVTDSKEKTFPGLGMGLYISKEIVRRHKGSIWVESDKDKGSTFYFTLPLQQKSVTKKTK